MSRLRWFGGGVGALLVVAALRSGRPGDPGLPAAPPPPPTDPELYAVPTDAAQTWSRHLRPAGPPDTPLPADAVIAGWAARVQVGRHPEGDPDRVWAVGLGLLVRAWDVAARDPAAGATAVGQVVQMGEALRDRPGLDDMFVGIAIEAKALRELTEVVDTWADRADVHAAAVAAVAGLDGRPPRLHHAAHTFCLRQVRDGVDLADPERVLGVRFDDMDLPGWTGEVLLDRDGTRARALDWCTTAVADWDRPRWERGDPARTPRWVAGAWDLRQYLDDPVGRMIEDRFATRALDTIGVDREDTLRAALAVVSAGLILRRHPAEPGAPSPTLPADPWTGLPLVRSAGEVWSAAAVDAPPTTAPLRWTAPSAPGARD